jgi:ribonuclease HII
MDARESLAELRRRYLDEALPLTPEAEAALRTDPRAGARALLAALERRRARVDDEDRRLDDMLRYERAYQAAGALHVAGVDEAGMSPLAGPVVAAAVVLPPGCRLPGVDDSKKLDAATRERLAPVIRSAAIAWGVGRAAPEEIDAINIHRAGLLAMRRAVEALGLVPDALLVDGKYRIGLLAGPEEAIIGGDGKSLSIAAASILAKTTRDALMVELDARYPGYGFAQHKGYPVRAHVEALERLGPCPVHRRSFAPVRRVSPG